MADVIDNIQDDPPTSSTLQGEAAQIFKTRVLKSRPAQPKRKPVSRRTLVLFAAALAAVAAISWWLHGRHFETTDDAQIDGHINVVSSRISGTVRYLNPQVENNQYIQSGTLLVELDPNDYQAALEHAKSDLTTKEGEARSAGVNVPITNASALTQLHLADAARDEAVAAVDSEEANLTAAQHRVKQDEAVYARPERA